MEKTLLGLGSSRRIFEHQITFVLGTKKTTILVIIPTSGPYKLKKSKPRLFLTTAARSRFTLRKKEKLTPGKLTWPWKTYHLKMYRLLNMVIFHVHVTCREGNPSIAAKVSVTTNLENSPSRGVAWSSHAGCCMKDPG